MNWDEWEKAGVVSTLDRRLATLLGGTPGVQLLTALVSARLREGHVCLDLEREAGRVLRDAEGQELLRLPSLEHVLDELRRSEAVRCVEDEGEGGAGGPRRPLVLRGRHLYLQRYDEHEQILAAAWAARLVDARVTPSELTAETVEELERLFPSGPEIDRQRRAAEVALRERFVIVSGGPGTGKTATVARILALFAARAARLGQPPPSVVLLAPTGKAAARMKESLIGARETLVAQGLPAPDVSEASTIHRALGVRADNKTRFHRSAESPLPQDVVIVDEASMVDLALMRHLVEAVRHDAKLILLGDRHQLASVEAGSVLAELWSALGGGAALGPERALVELTKSYRFHAQSGIAAFSRAVRDGDAAAAEGLLGEERPDLRFLARPSGGDGAHLAELEREIVEGWGGSVPGESIQDALERQTAFRVLCAHRRGPFGVEEWNERCREWLARAGRIGSGEVYYEGRPLLITQNDPARGLYNGDMGLVRLDAGRPYVWFEGATEPRCFSPAQLPEHETAFALTIHKSQGSEFERVLLVLPEPESRLLSRELLYTGVTRARREVVLVGERAAVRAACARAVERASGLGAALSSALAARSR